MQGPGKLAGYLYTMSRREALNWIERRRPDQVQANLANLDDLVSAVHPDLPNVQSEPSVAVAAVQDAIDSMSEREKEILSAVVSDCSNEEIAAICGVALDHARVLKKRALDKLKLRVRDLIRIAEQTRTQEEHQ